MELLAPAGGIIQGKSAVISGANAIYLGAQEFSARSGASNFNEEELKEMVDFAHVRGVDVHLAINTLLSDSQIEKLNQLITFSREIGIDAYIVQDLGVIRRVRALAPDVPIHGSTQMTVCNLEGVRMAEQLGLSRIVLSRELSKREIETIVKSTHLETEIFVHGALCVSYSGQCLLSSMVGGRSGNRGNCAQPCRKLYTSKKGKGYYLSPADMCLLEHLEEIKSIGVTSLKIEGRMKSPEYVSTVTSIYRKYLDCPQKVSESDFSILQNAFCRGDSFTDGYFVEKTGVSMMRPDISNDSIYKKQDKKMLQENANLYKEGNETKKVPLIGEFTGNIGMVPKLKICDFDHNEVIVCGEANVEAPMNEPLNVNRIEEQLYKVGATPFVWDRLKIEWDGGFLPIREINALRRNGFEKLAHLRAEKRKRTAIHVEEERQKNGFADEPFALEAIVQNIEQAEALLDCNVNKLYTPISVYEQLGKNEKLVPYLPSITSSEENKKYLQKLEDLNPQELLCTNIGHVFLAHTLGINPVAGFQLNLYNTEALNEANELGITRAILSVELNYAQTRDLYSKRAIPIEAIIYGKLPLMTTKNCLIKTAGKGTCGCQDEVVLKDKNGIKLLLKSAEGCKTVVYNTQPIYLGDKMQEIRKVLDRGVLFFTDETGDECKQILSEYEGKSNAVCPEVFTRGHFSRGV